MGNIDHWEKDPDDNSDYGIDWTDWLDTDTIATSVWTIETGSGLTTSSNAFTTTKTTIWLAGGTIREKQYQVTNKITTAGGRTKSKTLWFRVVEL